MNRGFHFFLVLVFYFSWQVLTFVKVCSSKVHGNNTLCLTDAFYFTKELQYLFLFFISIIDFLVYIYAGCRCIPHLSAFYFYLIFFFLSLSHMKIYKLLFVIKRNCLVENTREKKLIRKKTDKYFFFMEIEEKKIVMTKWFWLGGWWR